MPIAVVIDGERYAVHADHLNTPRKLSDAAGQTRWQWPYSGFGEINPQATPASGQAAVNYALRHPGQIDDGNGLFYNWHRFYYPRVGRYTKADPIGLEGGFNRFGYVGENPLGFVDPEGLAAQPGDNSIYPATENCSCVEQCLLVETDNNDFTVAGKMCSKLYKIPGPKYISFPAGKAIGEACKKMATHFVCISQCSDFCSNPKCPNPYPN